MARYVFREGWGVRSPAQDALAATIGRRRAALASAGAVGADWPAYTAAGRRV